MGHLQELTIINEPTHSYCSELSVMIKLDIIEMFCISFLCLFMMDKNKPNIGWSQFETAVVGRFVRNDMNQVRHFHYCWEHKILIFENN